MLTQIAAVSGHNPALLNRAAARDLSTLLTALDQRLEGLVQQGEVMRPMVDYLPELLQRGV
jgi:hypothetical protein